MQIHNSRTTEDFDEIDKILEGRTLQVYWWLLEQSEPKTRRQIQEAIGLSSRSLVGYHLKKLNRIGLVREESLNGYCVTKDVKVKTMKMYFLLRNRMVPRFALYSSFYISTLAISSFLLFPVLSSQLVLLISIILLFGLVTSIFESVVLVKMKP